MDNHEQRGHSKPAARTVRSPRRYPAGRGSVVVIAALGLAVAAVTILALMSGRRGSGFASMQSKDPAGTSTGSMQSPAQAIDHEAVRAALARAADLEAQGQFADAIGVLARAVQTTPSDQELRERLANLYMGQKKPGEAYEQFTEAIRIGPKRPDLDFAAGTMASMAGKPDVAISHYLAAQEADKTNAKYPLYAAQLQLLQGQKEAGKASLLRVTLLEPDNAFAWGTLADVALQENNAHIALQHIAKARKIQPDFLAWRLIQARAHKRVGQAEEALLALEGVSDLDRFNEFVLSTQAECFGLLSKPGEAAKRYAAAADALPAQTEFAYQAAVWFEKAKDPAKARDYAKRAATQGHKGAITLAERIGP